MNRMVAVVVVLMMVGLAGCVSSGNRTTGTVVFDSYVSVSPHMGVDQIKAIPAEDDLKKEAYLVEMMKRNGGLYFIGASSVGNWGPSINVASLWTCRPGEYPRLRTKGREDGCQLVQEHATGDSSTVKWIATALVAGGMYALASGVAPGTNISQTVAGTSNAGANATASSAAKAKAGAFVKNANILKAPKPMPKVWSK